MMPKAITSDLKPYLLWILPLIAAVVSLFAPVTPLAAAPEFQSHQTIRDVAANFLVKETKDYDIPPVVTVGRLDDRLNLAACDTKLETFLPPGGRLVGNVMVGVRCEGPKPWKIYVTARVNAYAKVVVTKKALIRGAILKDSDLALADIDLSTLRSGYINELSEAVGKQLKQPLSSGRPLNLRILTTPRLVRRGDQVVISASGSSVDVRMTGKALMDGGAGDRIRVKNLRSKRVIEATVASSGVVEVQM